MPNIISILNQDFVVIHRFLSHNKQALFYHVHISNNRKPVKQWFATIKYDHVPTEASLDRMGARLFRASLGIEATQQQIQQLS